MLKNFGFKHKSGILMSISSLPSKYGIGTFGKEAYDFVDFLDKTKQKCWQVLPLNPTSYGDSPYQSPSSVAGNPYFIDPYILYKEGLLTLSELESVECSRSTIDYGNLFNTRYKMLKCAFNRFTISDAYTKFEKENASWLDDYALFMSLKEHHNFLEWTKWDKKYQSIESARTYINEFENQINYWKFIQFKFFEQWNKLVEYVHSKDILIIGDMPIYVAHDSMDVWQNKDEFLLDENYNPVVVAGCPPDGFTPDGQLWGNPIYNWDKMEKDGFTWWCKRIKEAFKMYDILRIDHFRGFAGYYNIPFGDENARRGKWDKAPGVELFRKIKEIFPKSKIIAEDLGFITEDVRELLSDTEFPGMKILQFAFFDDDSEYLPRVYETPNCVVYTGTHDSDCTATWVNNLSGTTKMRFTKECKKTYKSDVYSLIHLAFTSIANLAIIPMQDYLELTNEEGRMNTPSVAEGNWVWRIDKDYQTDSLIKKIKEITIKTNREK